MMQIGPWHHKTWSTLVQVMAWCCQALSHYLNQCWIIINQFLGHSQKSYLFLWTHSNINHKNMLESHTFKITSPSLGVSELSYMSSGPSHWLSPSPSQMRQPASQAEAASGQVLVPVIGCYRCLPAGELGETTRFGHRGESDLTS